MLSELMEMVEPEWRTALERMMDQGEADPQFLEYLEQSPNGDAILEAALSVQSERLEALGETIRSLSHAENRLAARKDLITTVATRLREALEAAAAAGTRDRMHIFDEAFRDLHPDDLEILAVTLSGYRHLTNRRQKSA